MPPDLKFRSVLVNTKEVAVKLGMQTGEGGVTISDAAKEMGVSLDVVRFLIQARDDKNQTVLKTCGQVRHMGIMRDLIEPRSLDSVKRRFRKLSMIEGYWMREPDRLRSELAARGITPAWDTDVAGVELYRVSDL